MRLCWSDWRIEDGRAGLWVAYHPFEEFSDRPILAKPWVAPTDGNLYGRYGNKIKRDSMTRPGSWDRLRQRDRMRRHSFEDARGDEMIMRPLLQATRGRAGPPSKEELRAQAAAACVEWRLKRAERDPPLRQ
jgi:hypothetical protein